MPSQCEILMITAKKTPNGNWIVETFSRQPMIYLDQWALVRLSQGSDRPRRFLKVFERRGTLLFSWTNVLDVAAISGGTARRVKNLLGAIGEDWLPIEMNPFKVIRKEVQADPSSNTPCVSETFMETYIPHILEGPLNLSRVVDLTQQDAGAAARTELDRLKKEASDFVHQLRSLSASDPAWLDTHFPRQTFDSARPTAFVFAELLRVLIKDRGIAFTPNDAVDLFHTTVPTAWSDFVLLDKNWTKWVRSLALPADRVRAYYEYELDDFLTVFEKAVVGQ